MRMFPILSHTLEREALSAVRKDEQPFLVVGVPWSIMEPHGAQARDNHGQTLKTLAARGGLSHCEAVAVLENRNWRPMDAAEANKALVAHILSEPSP